MSTAPPPSPTIDARPTTDVVPPPIREGGRSTTDVSERESSATPGRPFHQAVRWVVLAWLVGGLMSVAAAATVPASTAGLGSSSLGWIAIGSLSVAMVAVLPGWISDRRRTSKRRSGVATHDVASSKRRKSIWDEARTLQIGLEFAASMALRLVGTVALFMLCRYHLAASPILVAAWVLAWYAWLTFAEVLAVCGAVEGGVGDRVKADRLSDENTVSLVTEMKAG